MAGLYFHIPFCKQACHYCDFHFSTSIKYKDQMISAMQRELILRANELSLPVQTIYFGGGTPSLLSAREIIDLLTVSRNHYAVAPDAEITLEANPDDITPLKLQALKEAGINRLSLGIQSFKAEDLTLMNRAHNPDQALQALEDVAELFQNYSVDLIYGLPGQSDADWAQNLRVAQKFDVPHLSCYALTQEPKTALDAFIKKGQLAPLDEVQAQAHYYALLDWAQQHNYSNYEFSNFGKPGFNSRNNTAYWSGHPYLGIGPSAHSYDQKKRSWNKAHNLHYIRDITKNELPSQFEVLSPADHFNEYIMTRLRTAAGVQLDEIAQKFGHSVRTKLYNNALKHLKSGVLVEKGTHLVVTRKGKFLSDGIASDLFLLNLER
jgi:oxygen-independent coproporphyrinogen III oxidase